MDCAQGIHCQSSKEVTDLVVKEVTERVNSKLSNRCRSTGRSRDEGCKPFSRTFTHILNTIVKHAVRLLTNFATYKSKQHPKMETDEANTPAVKLKVQDNEPVQTVESFQTPVTPLTEDEPVMNTGLRCVSLETLKHILEEQAGYISSINNDDITQSEYETLVSRNSQDRDRICI